MEKKEEKLIKTEKSPTSGETVLEKKEQIVTGNVPKSELKAAGAGLWSFFGRQTPDAAPGWNILNLTIPAGTSVISVWMTEWIQGNLSHAGSAWFTTTSVQLYNNGNNCRVRYYLDWGSYLPAGYQVILG
jgi:hypothetical protein